jgi:uroporphyrinogen decarboxylase
MIKPHHARFVGTLHSLTDAKVIMHSDGSIRELLADIIDCGVDVINPVQTNAQGMEPGPLKAEYGKDVCFWGGIDTQKVLPFGSAAEVAQEVRDRIGDLGSGGGYVVAPFTTSSQKCHQRTSSRCTTPCANRFKKRGPHT